MSVVAQVLVPLAGTLAADHERGKVVGNVMSGLLLGILLARTASGLIASVGGWRSVYVIGALLMVALSAVLHRALPDTPRVTTLPYGQLLRSVGALVRDEPVLRRRMVYGAVGMASFSVLWTAIAFLLSGDPYNYGEGTIGLFGLAGLVGAGAAQRAGRLHDRGHGHAATGAFLLAIAVSWVLIALGETSLAALIAGIVLLDLGIQGQHILNQSTVYALRRAGALAPDDRVHDQQLHVRGDRLGGRVVGLDRGRLGRDQRARRRARGRRAARVGRGARPDARGAARRGGAQRHAARLTRRSRRPSGASRARSRPCAARPSAGTRRPDRPRASARPRTRSSRARSAPRTARRPRRR